MGKRDLPIENLPGGAARRPRLRDVRCPLKTYVRESSGRGGHFPLFRKKNLPGLGGFQWANVCLSKRVETAHATRVEHHLPIENLQAWGDFFF